MLRTGAGIVAARPVLFASLALFSTLAGIVADNALNRQAGRHPHPMLATRGAQTTRLAETRLTGAAQAAPVPTARAAVAAPSNAVANDPRIMPFPLVREAQVLLSQQGYYKADIDGRPGQATDMAIRDFQSARGLKVDGMATPLLLSQLRQAANPPSESDDPIARLAAGGTVDPAATGGIGAAPDTDLVRQIQAKLAEARVADLKADGIMGERTRAAIRTFQALESLEVTGEPSREVLDRLNETGASASR